MFDISTFAYLCQQIIRLHSHDRSTDFVHSILDLVQTHMLVIDATGSASSGDILAQLQQINQKVIDDQNLDFALKPNSVQRQRLKIIPLEAEIDSKARDLILKDNQSRMMQNRRFSKQTSLKTQSIRIRVPSVRMETLQDGPQQELTGFDTNTESQLKDAATHSFMLQGDLRLMQVSEKPQIIATGDEDDGTPSSYLKQKISQTQTSKIVKETPFVQTFTCPLITDQM